MHNLMQELKVEGKEDQRNKNQEKRIMYKNKSAPLFRPISSKNKSVPLFRSPYFVPLFLGPLISTEFLRSKNSEGRPLHRRSSASMQPQHTLRPRQMLLRCSTSYIPVVVYSAAPLHPCSRGIQYILGKCSCVALPPTSL